MMNCQCCLSAGSAVLMNALGGHAIAMEMMDVMETPRQVG